MLLMLLLKKATRKNCARSMDSQIFLNRSDNVKRSCLRDLFRSVQIVHTDSYLSLLPPLLQNLQMCPDGQKGRKSGSLCSAKHRPECELCTEKWRSLKIQSRLQRNQCLWACLGRPTPALCSGSPCRASGTCAQLKITVL